MAKFWWLPGWVRRSFAEHLAHPEKSLVGYLAFRFMRDKNRFLERAMVEKLAVKPDDTVLEIGFGPGSGILAAYSAVEHGKGIVYGVDSSTFMVEMATKMCCGAVKEGKVQLHHALASHMPFGDDFFDGLFHSNCYYFWGANKMLVLSEILRVMKPNATMVTGLYLDGLKMLKNTGYMSPETYAKTDPLAYMDALETAGFRDVNIRYLSYKDRLTYQMILAKKPADQVRNGEEEALSLFKRLKEDAVEEGRMESMRRVGKYIGQHEQRLFQEGGEKKID